MTGPGGHDDASHATPAPIPQQLRFEQLAARARRLAHPGRRRILGICGAPGAGKSTLAQRLVAALGANRASHVGMDGYHLAGAMLRRLGRQDRKGAIDTFDADGYAAVLARLSAARPGDRPVYAPAFDRNLEEPIAGAVALEPDVPLVITEGNYLLADGPGWGEVRRHLTEVWYLAPDDHTRLERLVARHMAHGNDEQTARAWSLGSDQANAELIAATAARADLVVRLAD